MTGKVRTIYSLYYANMSTSVQFTTTAKGRPLMVLDGYSYIRDRQTDEKTYWDCENHKNFNCHYRIHTCNFMTNAAHANILKCNGVHTTSCHRDSLKISLRKFHEDLVDRTKTTQESSDIVLSKCLTQLSTPARLRVYHSWIMLNVQSVIIEKKMIYQAYPMMSTFHLFQQF